MLVYLILFACITSIVTSGVYDSRCPLARSIIPCRCSEVYGNLVEGTVRSSMFCFNELDLPKLTHILRNVSCGRRLQEFRLDSSDIGYLPSNLFSKIEVEAIKIFSTNISHFTDAGYSAFYGQEKHLKLLSMRRCRLVDELQWEKIGDLRILETLDLSMNELTTIPKQWFDHPPRNLKFLHLQGNRITYIQPGALQAMDKLMLIDLSENQLTNLDRTVFPYPGNSITILRLSYNQLTNLPVNFFDELFGLRRLYLDHNELTTLDAETWLPIWGELYILDVSDNKILCDCNIKWITWINQLPTLNGVCVGRNSLRGNYIAALYYWSFDSFNCSDTEPI